jgi:hypothetical protein
LAASPHLAHLASLGMKDNNLSSEGQALLRQRFRQRVSF